MDPDRIKGTVRNTVGQGESAVGELVGSSRTQAQGLTDRAAGAAQDAYGRVKDTARDALDRAPDTWSDAVGSGQDYARQGAVAVRDRVNDQPLTALVIAGAIGFLLAWAISRRS
jgi:uncharacterized protein YjbJ (UPF0337 family)